VHRFGERWEASGEDLIIEAFQEALADAGIEKKEIQAAWFGTHIDEVNVGKSGVPWPHPETPLHSRHPHGKLLRHRTEAFRGACYAVAAGFTISAWPGVEKLKDTGYGGLRRPPPSPDAGPGGPNARRRGSLRSWPRATSPNTGSIQAGEKAIAHISAKSHANGALNPKPTCARPYPKSRSSCPMIAYPSPF